MSQVQQRAMGGTPEQRAVAQQVQSIFDSATREGIYTTYYDASQISIARDAISAALDARPLPASTDYITAPTLLTPAATDFNTVNLEGVTVTANREADASFFGSVGDRLVQNYRQSRQLLDDAVAGAGQWIDKAETSLDHARGSLRDWSMQNGGSVGGAIGKYVSDQIGLAEGFSLGAAHAVTGVVSLAVWASDLVNPVTWALDSQRNIDHVKSTYRTIDTLNSVVDVTRWLTNPQQSLANTKALVDGFTQEYRKDLAAGDLPKALGRGAFEVGSAVTPFLAGKLGKVETAARAADEAAASARAAEEAAAANRPDVLRDSSVPSTKVTNSSGVAGGADRPTIMFGQRRVGETFSPLKSDGSGPPAYLAGQPISDVAADLRAKILSPDQLPIQAFYYGEDGVLVSANTRSLSALSEAGMQPTNVTIIGPSRALLRRLREEPIVSNAPLPGPRVPVTPSQQNLQVIRIIQIPGSE